MRQPTEKEHFTTVIQDFGICRGISGISDAILAVDAFR
jgi:hypothetical protein